MSEERRGKSVGRDQAYVEGYAAKYDEWVNRDNPYREGTVEHDAFNEGYAEAVAFA